MSSSAPKRQLVPASPAAEDALFAYPEAELPSSVAHAEANAAQAADERSRRQLAEAFEQGRQNAQQQLGSEFDVAIVKHREQINHALRQFSLERQTYYRRIEGEVVELALAIARKILHREVQIDPHTLAGIVRVTLEKLDSGTQVHLHVYPKEASDWRHYFACQMQDVRAPEGHEDPAIAAGECRIETSLGSTQIGLQSQLKEIETGLLDLLAERPDAAALSPSSTAIPNRAPEVC